MPKKTRIKIPRTGGNLIGLAVNIKVKHEADGKNSPIDGLDWDTFGPKIDQANQLNAQIVSQTTQTEQLIQQRDSLVGDLGGFVRSSRDVLQGVHRPALRKLSDWGFSVDDTPRSPRKAAPVKPGGNN